MYHCGTPMVLEHIASGMYGMMIVEPREGYPTKVDREYAVIQSEFYTKPDPQKRKVDGQPLYVLDGDRVRSKAPTYTVFNGRYNGMVDKPLPAKPGERVRLFVMNVGPSNTSSFHVVGTIFDRVWIDGNPGQPVPRHADGAAGLVGRCDRRVHGPGGRQLRDGRPPLRQCIAGRDRRHRRRRRCRRAAIPNTTTSRPRRRRPIRTRQKGKLAFESKCLACHSIGGGDKLGPDLFGTTKRHDEAWLTRWLKSPEQMLQSDPIAKAMLDKWKIPMPNQGLSDEEIRQYLAYFKWADQNLQPKGTGQPQPSAPGTALPPSQTRSADADAGTGWQAMRAARAGPRRRRRTGARAGHACGVCDEDKVAATYDHAVVRRANLQGRVMVFCEVRGPLDARRLQGRREPRGGTRRPRACGLLRIPRRCLLRSTALGSRRRQR